VVAASKLADMLRTLRSMTYLVLLRRRFAHAVLAGLALLVVSATAEAQGIGFQGGATVDPEQMFVGTHFETGNIYQGLRFRPGIDGSWGGDFSLATINIEFTYHTQLGRSPWSIYQGFGPAIVLLRQDTNTDVHAGSFFTFGFGHRSGFFTEFKYGGGSYPTLKFGAGFTLKKNTP
jgi:hypothetical protein